LLSFIDQGKITPCVSVPLVLEYEQTLIEHRADLKQTEAGIHDVLDYICSAAIRQNIYFLWRPFLRDPGDDMVLEAAVASGAEFVVTYNKRDFVGAEAFGVKAVSPSELIRKIGGQK